MQTYGDGIQVDINSLMESGFYWVRLCNGDLTIGFYDRNKEMYPWTIIGYDEWFQSIDIVAFVRLTEQNPQWNI